MGIQGLLPFLKKSSRPVKLSEFKGKTAAVDVYCWLHKGAFACAEKLVKGEPTDGYILYVMKQVNMLLSYNIKPILVFDGCHLPAKGITELKRRENRIKNRRKAQELLREGKIKEARECFQRCVDITSTMAHETIKACRARNIDTIVAPYEADSQLAYLSHAGIADVVITEDSDLILFGCEKIIFKIDNNGGGMLVEKEKLHLSMNVSRDKFNFNKFRNMCILSGCDYLPSLHGIGLVKACRFFIVTSNPDVFTALCKLPINLKMPHLEVTLEYRQSFMKAINTLLHQLVFDPFIRILRPLTSYPPGTDHEDMSYCGKFFGHERAYQIALGNVDVQTGETVDNYDPVTSEKPEMKSSGWNQKGDLVSNHPSIWDPEYETLVENWSKSESEKVDANGTMRGKNCVVDVSILKRKRIVSTQPDKDEISEEFLESVYSSKKLKTSEDEDIKIKEEDSDTLLVKEELKSPTESPDRKDKEASSCLISQEQESLSNPDPNSSDRSISDDSIFSQFDKVDEAIKTPSRNPFAKKIVDFNFSNSENLNPLKCGKFSALKRFTTPVIVRSRYFKSDEDTSIEKENLLNTSSDSSLKIEQHIKASNDSERKLTDQESPPIKSPLKPKNVVSVFDTPPNTTPPKRVKEQKMSSFNWGRKSLAQQFSFTSKEKLSSAINDHRFKQDNLMTSETTISKKITLDTPPNSQNEFSEISQGMNITPPELDTNFETKNDVESGSDVGVPSRLTPSQDEERKTFSTTSKNKKLKTKSSSRPKCRVSGLKKPSPTKEKQKQLNLKDMFAFKKDIKKIASISN